MERFLATDRGIAVLALGLAMIGAVTALVDINGNVRWLLLVGMSPFIARVVVPRFPAWTASLVTTIVVVVANLDGAAEGAFFLTIVAVLAVTATDPNRSRAYVMSAVAFLSPAAAWVLAGDDGRDWTWPFWSMGVLLTASSGTVLYRQRTLTDQLLDARQRLAYQAVADERRRIAREVHDLVGHSLSVAQLHVTGARHLLRRDVDEAERALIEAERVGRENLAEIRHTVGLLREGAGFGTAPTPGIGDLSELINEYRRGGLNVEFTVRGTTTALDGVTGLTLYRVAQESLTNVVKHAPDGRATVSIDIATEKTTIEVFNSLAGHPIAPRTGGVGIIGMRERARSVGGDLVAGPTVGGWKVSAWLPHIRDNGGDREHPPREP